MTNFQSNTTTVLLAFLAWSFDCQWYAFVVGCLISRRLDRVVTNLDTKFVPSFIRKVSKILYVMIHWSKAVFSIRVVVVSNNRIARAGYECLLVITAAYWLLYKDFGKGLMIYIATKLRGVNRRSSWCGRLCQSWFLVRVHMFYCSTIWYTSLTTRSQKNLCLSVSYVWCCPDCPAIES